MIEKYYFTFGTEGQPYVGGWVEIEAPSEKIACDIYRALYMPFGGDLLNCAGVYSQGEFEQTRMFKIGKNFTHGCYERISFKREVLE